MLLEPHTGNASGTNHNCCEQDALGSVTANILQVESKSIDVSRRFDSKPRREGILSVIAMLQHLCAGLEGAQRDLLLAVDFEECVQPRDLEEVSYSLVDLDKFHLASPLSDCGKTSDQFAHAIAVHVIHSREIE